MNIEHKLKWYTCPGLKERMRTISQRYGIRSCHRCQNFPSVKLIWKLDGINLVEYYCESHKEQIPK
jgi:hypothetical protein